MATSPLVAARYPAQTDSPLGGTQIGYAVLDLEDNTIPRFATTGARDTAYAAWVAAGGTMEAGLHCTIAGRLQRHTGAAWEYVPGNRGSGNTFPTGPVEGDTFRHTLYGCTMRYRNGSWVQDDLTRVSTAADRATWLAALVAAGFTMHGGFMVRQDADDTLWWADTNTTLKQLAGLTTYTSRPVAQIQRTTMSIAANADPDNWTVVNNWAAVTTTTDITVAAGGAITCNRDGWLSVSGYCWSDDNVAGRAGVALDVPAAAFPVGRIMDIRPRVANTTYGSAGVLRQWIAWSGRVKTGDVFRIYLNQDSADDGAVAFNIYAALEYQA